MPIRSIANRLAIEQHTLHIGVQTVLASGHYLAPPVARIHLVLSCRCIGNKQILRDAGRAAPCHRVDAANLSGGLTEDTGCGDGGVIRAAHQCGCIYPDITDPYKPRRCAVRLYRPRNVEAIPTLRGGRGGVGIDRRTIIAAIHMDIRIAKLIVRGGIRVLYPCNAGISHAGAVKGGSADGLIAGDGGRLPHAAVVRRGGEPRSGASLERPGEWEGNAGIAPVRIRDAVLNIAPAQGLGDVHIAKRIGVIVQTSGQLIPGLSIFGDLDRGRLRVAVEGVAVDDEVHAIGIARVIFNIGLVPFAVPQGILDVAAAGTQGDAGRREPA